MNDIIASTDPSYTPVWVLMHTIYHPERFQPIERELEGMYSSQKDAEKQYWSLLRYDQNVYTANSLIVQKRDLRFGEGDYE
jgi:hypothetical protein